MIYSSITPYVHMLYTSEDDQEHIELDFSARRRGRGAMYGYDSFGVSDYFLPKPFRLRFCLGQD
jgi:WD repeat-containing protein 23